MTGVLSRNDHIRVIDSQSQLLVYLSGSIRKGSNDDRDSDNFWGDAEEKALLQPVRSAKITTLNPARSDLRRNDYYANFGCDLHLVAMSDAVVVDARTEKGVGVGAEMMFASQRGIPVITVAPKNTNYRRDFLPNVFGEDLHDWVHPFVFGLSSNIVDGFEQAGELLEELATARWQPDPTPSMEDAMSYYLRVRETWARQPNG